MNHENGRSGLEHSDNSDSSHENGKYSRQDTENFSVQKDSGVDPFALKGKGQLQPEQPERETSSRSVFSIQQQAASRRSTNR